MAASWSIAGGVVTLTLDGTGSGPVSRSRTFTLADGITADEIHTVYLVVDPSVVAIGAFLEVVGGDTAVADVTGTQTLRARGMADGSANLTVRYGAQSIEAAPSSAGSDGLEYVNNAAAETSDWVFTGGASAGATDQVHGGSRSFKMVGSGTATKVFTGLTPGATYTPRIWGHMSAKEWFDSGSQLRAMSGAGTPGPGPSLDSTSVTGWQRIGVTVNADGAGVITVQAYRSGGETTWFDDLTIEGVSGSATIDFSELRWCLGSGISETGGTGLGPGADDDSPGDDPIPEPPEGGYAPPPGDGTRLFGLFGLPPDGLGYWNFTAKVMSPTWIPNLINKARTAGAWLLLTGRQSEWFDGSGRFSLDIWKAQMYRAKTDPIAGPILDGAIADGTTPAHMLIDEPYHPLRYGGPLSEATVEAMGLFSQSLWPTWKTLVRVAPIDPWLTRHLNGCDWLWAEYHLHKGAVEAYRDNNIARAQALGHELVVGIHYYDFGGVGSGTFITPDQLRHYGGIMASQSYSIGFGGWEYRDGLLLPSGMHEAIRYVRDLDASYHP